MSGATAAGIACLIVCVGFGIAIVYGMVALMSPEAPDFFSCNGSWDHQHHYVGTPPCPECQEIERRRVAKATR